MRVSAFPRPPHFCSSIPSETDGCLFSRTGKFRTSFSLCEAKAIRVAGRNGLGVCGWRRRSKFFAWDIRNRLPMG
ncbi:MAG: hypothetical protein QOF56_2355 [Acidobacteriaceae bacterium]|nr:hypothetical protein [Acidobacteriaceae bacterium]